MRFAVKIAILLESVYDYFFPPAISSHGEDSEVIEG